MTQIAKVIILGADSVGKTSLLYQLKLGENVKTTPTKGFNVEDINYKEKIIRMWDIGGEKTKYIWNQYIENIKPKCLIYVFNLTDKDKFDNSIKYFNLMLDCLKTFGKVPIIIFGNKFNDKAEFEPEEILKNLPQEISPLILKGNANTGEGLSELLDCVYNNVEFADETNEQKKEEQKPEFKIKMFGLDNVGKTIILYLLQIHQKVRTIPTIGFNYETIENEPQGNKITIWDIGGYKKIRNLWAKYLPDTNGLIWVYDISKKEKYEESQNGLKSILNNPEIKPDTPLLIFANKSDLNKAGNKVEDFINGIQDYLNNRTYFIKECNQDNLDAYKEGLDWLCNNIK